MRFLLFFWHLAVSVCVSFKSCHCPDDGEPAAGVVSFPRTIEVGESPALPQDRARHLHKSWWDVLRKVVTHSGASVVVISGHWHHPFARVVAAKGSQRGIKIGIELLSTSELFSSIIEENSSDVDSIVWIWHFSVKVGNMWRKMERKELSLEIPQAPENCWQRIGKEELRRKGKESLEKILEISTCRGLTTKAWTGLRKNCSLAA